MSMEANEGRSERAVTRERRREERKAASQVVREKRQPTHCGERELRK